MVYFFLAGLQRLQFELGLGWVQFYFRFRFGLRFRFRFRFKFQFRFGLSFWGWLTSFLYLSCAWIAVMVCFQLWLNKQLT